jgi:hypothetical protein
VTRDRCYEFLNNFAEKFSGKNWHLWLKTKLNCAKLWSWHWFLRKTPKTVENRRKLWL